MATPLNNSVLKAFEILSLIRKSRPEVSSAIVAEQLGLNNATAHRFLMTLESAGALRTTKRGYFALGPKIDELGQVSEETGAIGILLQPKLEELGATLNESVMVSKLSRNGPKCLAVRNSSRTISVSITIGTVLPFLSSAQGKLWLADMDSETRSASIRSAAIAGQSYSVDEIAALETELAEIKAQGFAMNLGDNEPDIGAVSAPVRNHEGEMILSLSVFGLLRRFDESFIATAKKELSGAAKGIAEHLN